MQEYTLKYGDFVSLQPEIFENDIEYHSNTLMNIHVESGGFCGNAPPDSCSGVAP